ncbi:DUF4320 family protein [Paenibacillus sp. FSL R5-0527]|uniref:DUF4320 family protein n=1 Tax=Paenibacillus sp. FSL R5-0527 TaxID=2975321 RepID=UPI00097ABD88|nr:hypothetical protein BK140_16935 [Paenibacillus macerans]
MIHNLRKFNHSERGDALFGIPFAVLIFMILALIAVTVIEYSILRANIRTAANEMLQVMKIENGADSKTRQRFNELLTNMGLDPAKVTFQATPKLVQRGDLVEVTATREYDVFALKALGVHYTTTIRVHVSGLAHKYIREGG